MLFGSRSTMLSVDKHNNRFSLLTASQLNQDGDGEGKVRLGLLQYAGEFQVGNVFKLLIFFWGGGCKKVNGIQLFARQNNTSGIVVLLKVFC